MCGRRGYVDQGYDNIMENNGNIDTITPSLLTALTQFVIENYLLLWGLFFIFCLYVVYYKNILEFINKFTAKSRPVDIAKDNTLRAIRERQQEKLKRDAIAESAKQTEKPKERKYDPRLDMLQGKSKTPGFDDSLRNDTHGTGSYRPTKRTANKR